jgi:hypothetical protein
VNGPPLPFGASRGQHGCSACSTFNSWRFGISQLSAALRTSHFPRILTVKRNRPLISPFGLALKMIEEFICPNNVLRLRDTTNIYEIGHSSPHLTKSSCTVARMPSALQLAEVLSSTIKQWKRRPAKWVVSSAPPHLSGLRNRWPRRLHLI